MSNKELTDLQVCIAIAELKGFEYTVCLDDTGDYIEVDGQVFHPVACGRLNVELRDEYEVTVDYQSKEVEIHGEVSSPESDAGYGIVCIASVAFDDKTQINRAAMLCILESVK